MMAAITLDNERVLEIYQAAIDGGLASHRRALLAGLEQTFVASLPREDSDAAQLLLDLTTLNGVFEVGSVDPLIVWLRNAMSLCPIEQHHGVFERTLSARAGAEPISQDMTSTPPLVSPRAASSPMPGRVAPTSSNPTPIPMPVTSGRRPIGLGLSASPLAVIGAPPPPPLHFVGREVETLTLAQILASRNPFDTPRRAVIDGIGGIGKTALALHFASVHAHHFPGGILWGDLGVDANHREIVRAVLQRWLPQLNHPVHHRDLQGEPSLDALLGSVKSCISTRVSALGPALLILDNAEALEALMPFLDTFSDCAILVTTRQAELVLRDRKEITVHLQGLRPSESRGYLSRLLEGCPTGWLETFDKAIEGLDGHPLGLSLLAGALRKNPLLRPTEFFARIKEGVSKSSKALPRRDSCLMHVPERVEDCFRGSVAEIPVGATRSLLIATASLSPEPWSAEAIDYISGVRDPRKTRIYLEELVARGLVETAGDRFCIHRLLRDYLRAAHGREGFGFIPRTWEISWLPWMLMRVAPGIPAGEAIYDIQQEHWSLRYTREHQDNPVELRREWAGNLEGLRRRAALGFGPAMRARLELLRGDLRWADLSGLRLDRAALDGVDLTHAQMSNTILSGTPVQEGPSNQDVMASLKTTVMYTGISIVVLAISLAVSSTLRGAQKVDQDLLVLLPLALIAVPGPLAALLLQTARLRAWLDRLSLRSRYALERAAEVVVFWLIGLPWCLLMATFTNPFLFIWRFTTSTAIVAPAYGLAMWGTLSLVRVAGRFEIGGLGIRVGTAMIMVALTLLAPLALLPTGGIDVAAKLTQASLPMALYALAVGMIMSPERHLLTSLRTSYLRKATLRGAELVEAKLGNVKLTGADLRNADLSRADLSGACLTRANLSGAMLVGAKLHGAHLDQADLSGADLSGADLSGATLDSATLTRVIDKDTRWPDGFTPPESRDCCETPATLASGRRKPDS